MQIVEIEKNAAINYKDYIRRSALETDGELLIDFDCVLVDKHTKDVLVIYKKLDDENFHEQVFDALSQIQFLGGTKRMSGLTNTGQTKILGYVPRNRVKTTDQACRMAILAKEAPSVHQLLCEYAKSVNDVYSDGNKERFERHTELTKKVNNNYVIPGTLFTSGIVNLNNPLKYHFDAGNFTEVCSAMIAFKRDIGGGHLALPEYNVKLAIQDRTITLFDGQNLLHGVTPIKKLTPEAKRYTVVFYSLVGMWQCLPLDEEVANARQARWESELKKYERKFSDTPTNT